MIREHVRVVECPLPDSAVVVHELPGGARVVAAEQASMLVLDECIHALGVGLGDGDADPAHDSFLR